MTDKAEEYGFDDIKVGHKFKFTEKITEKLLNNFATLSGDQNPLHMDENYANKDAFKKRVCHGMLLASFFSRLIGMHLPGKNALYFSQSLNFKSPCFIGDEVTVEGEIADKSMATKILVLNTTIYNQSGQCLVDGIAKVIVRE